MLYHCGLLDEQPERSVTLQWIRRGGWELEGFPEQVYREIMIWLAMPGFPIEFHTRTFMVSHATIMRYAHGFEKWKDDVIANWLSATREDCIKLSLMRPGPKHVPVISQMQAITDIKAGMTQAEVARTYRVSSSTAGFWAKGRIKPAGVLPSGFWLLEQPQSRNFSQLTRL